MRTAAVDERIAAAAAAAAAYYIDSRAQYLYVCVVYVMYIYSERPSQRDTARVPVGHHRGDRVYNEISFTFRVYLFIITFLSIYNKLRKKSIYTPRRVY